MWLSEWFIQKMEGCDREATSREWRPGGASTTDEGLACAFQTADAMAGRFSQYLVLLSIF
jgi:hypothetical protein